MKRRRVFLSRDRLTAHAESCPMKGKARPWTNETQLERVLRLRPEIRRCPQCLSDERQEPSA